MAFPYNTVLVVGATSGIGLALAEKLIAQGSHVIALGRRQERLDDLQRKHGQARLSTIRFDITDLAGIPGLVERVTESYPTLDSVVLNSGIQRGLDFTRPESIDLTSISTELTTNYISYIHLTVAFLPFLQKQSSPASLVYITSALALVPITRCANYCASKAALHHLTLCLREQLRGTNVRIIEVLPPAVQTELHDERHQPDLKGMSRIGMPLDEFTEKEWKGLIDGNEQVPVGMAEVCFEAFEIKRQDIFRGLLR